LDDSLAAWGCALTIVAIVPVCGVCVAVLLIAEPSSSRMFSYVTGDMMTHRTATIPHSSIEAAARKLLIALAALTASDAANASDLAPRTPTYKAPMPAAAVSWTGFYVGANGGGAWGLRCWTFVATAPAVGLPAPLDEGCHNPSGGVLGGQIGYNWQAGLMVFGLEAQGDWTNLQGRNVSLLPAPPFPPSTNHTRVDSLGLFTGRLGFAWGSALLYAKGGAAVVHDKYDFALNGVVAPPVFASETRWGGTIGAGIEYKFTQNWSAGVEYNYIDLGTSRLTFPSQPLNAIVDINQDLHAVTARINYSFH
jgi:outer membrane immunogenic protein